LNGRVPAKKFAIAGTKDKRGITVQQVTAHRMQPQQLLSINQKLTNVLIGNIRMVKEQLSLGQLSGNYFTVVVRELDGQPSDIEERIKTFTEKGFINYFGLQRFGTRQVSTSDVGRLLLQSNWEQAIRSILTSEGQVFDEQLLMNANDCPSDLFSKKAIAENVLFNFLKENPGSKDFLGAIQRIPRNLKSMYLHSYQSLVWNHAVTHRLQEYGLSLVIGDMVKSNGKVIHLTERKSLSQFTMNDLVLPLPGHAMEYPSNLKDFYKEALAKDGLDIEQMERPQK
jgi:tRNA pseudouridine13 synthase